MRSFVIALGMLIASGCGGDRGGAGADGGGAGGMGGAGGSGDGGGAGGAGGTVNCPATSGVSGSAINVHVTESGEMIVPVDLSTETIIAWVPGSSGGFSMLAGTGLADGTFTIPGVPNGDYYLQFGSTYLKTSARCVDIGAPVLGRPDVLFATARTNVTFNVTGLEPWQSNSDDGQFFSVGGNAFAFHIGTIPLAQGATTMNTTINWLYQAYPNGLVDGTKGDVGYLMQVATRATSNGVGYLALSRVFQSTPFTLTNGQSTTVSGAFTAVPQSLMVNLDWDHVMFENMRGSIHPNAVLDGLGIGLSAQPSGALGPYGAAPSLVEAGPPAGSATALGAMSYGNPFPASWSTVGGASMFVAMYYTLPGDTYGTSIFGGVQYGDLEPAFSASTVRPLVGPVLQPRVDGNDAFASLTNVSTTPTLSWTAPSLGTPNGYFVTVYQLVHSGLGYTQNRIIAFIYSTDTTVTLPPGILAPSQSYVFVIASMLDGNIDVGAHPLRLAYPFATAQVMSEMMTTGAGGAGGTDGGVPDAAIDGPRVDGSIPDAPASACDPAAQTGCSGSTTKCAVEFTGPDPSLVCAAPGTVSTGGACLRLDGGAIPGDDNCIDGYCSALGVASGRQCVRYCGATENTCQSGQFCSWLAPPYGTCRPICDPFASNTCPQGNSFVPTQVCSWEMQADQQGSQGMCLQGGNVAVGGSCNPFTTPPTDCAQGAICLGDSICHALCDNAHPCAAGQSCIPAQYGLPDGSVAFAPGPNGGGWCFATPDAGSLILLAPPVLPQRNRLR